ncbi:MAG: VOC family protein [Hyphomicrobium sp.]
MAKEKATATKVTAKPKAAAATKPPAHPVIPHLVCDGAAKAIEFYKKAFGAVEAMRLEGRDGFIMHACVMIEGAPIFLVDQNLEYGAPGPKALKGSPVFIHLNVPDADAVAARATKAGAKITMPVTEMFWGDRYGQLEDPFGHRWSVATPVKAMTPDEIKAAMRKAMPA